MSSRPLEIIVHSITKLGRHHHLNYPYGINLSAARIATLTHLTKAIITPFSYCGP